MVDGLPSPTPEGQLIRRVRGLTIPKLSIRNAAMRIGMSAEQWGYIERGYLPSRGGKPPQPFSPPAATLARMAYALEITPERLESEGQRPDAAKILREILHHEVEAADAAGASETFDVAKSDTIPSPPMTDAARTAADRPYADKIWQQLHALAAQGITDPSGHQLFPHFPADAQTWDDIGTRLDTPDRVWLIADLRRRDAERRRHSGTEPTA
jgi:transcriptional regulator with XRE-family HTH domain